MQKKKKWPKLLLLLQKIAQNILQNAKQETMKILQKKFNYLDLNKELLDLTSKALSIKRKIDILDFIRIAFWKTKSREQEDNFRLDENICKAFWLTVWQLLIKLNVHLPWDWKNYTLGINPEE